MCSLLSLILSVTEALNSLWWEPLVTWFFLRGTQIVVLALRSHIKPAGWSSGGQKTRRDNAALITGTALCVISGCSVSVWAAPFLHLPSVPSSSSLVFSTQWHFSLGHPRSQSAARESLHGLQLLSWTLSCFINAKQSRSYHSINTTCWSRARPSR